MASSSALAPATHWQLRTVTLSLDAPRIMGVLNVTPDSFSDAGRFFSVDAAVAQAVRMVDEGADLLDVGGESTRPQGAVPVPADEEVRRVIPVLRAVRRRLPTIPVSVDTVKSAVARAALDEGAEAINDVSGLRLDPAIAATCAAAGAGLVLMHSRGSVSDMATYQHAVYGADPAGEVIAELRQAVRRAEEGGVAGAHIALDPGVGFSKRSEHSLIVLGALDRLAALGYPVVVGVSRKRVVGELSGVAEPEKRVEGTIGANVMALALGARIFRVHDVAAARRALDVAWGIARTRTPS